MNIVSLIMCLVGALSSGSMATGQVGHGRVDRVIGTVLCVLCALGVVANALCIAGVIR